MLLPWSQRDSSAGRDLDPHPGVRLAPVGHRPPDTLPSVAAVTSYRLATS